MELTVEMCPKCYNPQPIFKKCSICDVESCSTCVDGWALKPTSPSKKPWTCNSCKPNHNKENESPNRRNEASPRKRYDNKDEDKTKKAVKTPPKIKKWCLKCVNSQPVFRVCCNCDRKAYYTCVGSDCWNIILKSSEKKSSWICPKCEPDCGIKEAEGANKEEKYYILAPSKEIKAPTEDEDYDESEIFDINTCLEFEINRSKTNIATPTEFIDVPKLKESLSASNSQCDEDIRAPLIFQADSPIQGEKSFVMVDDPKSFEIDLKSWEPFYIKEFKRVAPEGAGGILKESEQFTGIRDVGIAKAKVAVSELDEKRLIADIEEAMNDGLYDDVRFKSLQDFWETVSGGDKDNKEKK